MKKIIFGILVLVVFAVGAIFVAGQKAGHKNGPGFEWPGRGHMMGLALRGLDLTDDQKAKVKEIMEASRTNVEPLMQQMRDNHAKIADLSKDGTFDQARVETIAADQGGVMAKLIVEREKAKAQVFALLTDAQKANAAEMRQKFDERMKDHKGFDGKRGGAEF